jgi:hypothetical protein
LWIFRNNYRNIHNLYSPFFSHYTSFSSSNQQNIQHTQYINCSILNQNITHTCYCNNNYLFQLLNLKNAVHNEKNLYFNHLLWFYYLIVWWFSFRLNCDIFLGRLFHGNCWWYVFNLMDKIIYHISQSYRI